MSEGFDGGLTRPRSLSLINVWYGDDLRGLVASLEGVIEHDNSGIQNHPNLGDTLTDANGQAVQLNLTTQQKNGLSQFLKNFD